MTDKERLAALEKEVSELKKKQVEAKDILEIMRLIGEAKKEYIPYPVYPRPLPYWPYQPYTPIWTTAGASTGSGVSDTARFYLATPAVTGASPNA